MTTTLFSQYSFFYDLAIALLTLFLFCSILERLSNKSSPMLWPVLGIIPTLLAHVDDLYGFLTKALIKAGGTFHYRGVWMGGARGVVTCDPANVEYMLKTNFRNFPKGKYYRERFQDLLGNGIFNSDDESWMEQRGVAKSEMHSTRFIEHSFQVTENLVLLKLIKLMEKKMMVKNECFDLQELLLRFTFDNICSTAFGVDPGCLDGAMDSPKANPFARAFEEATELSLTRFLIPPFIWKPMKWLQIGYERKLKEAVGIVHGFADEIVKERKQKFSKDENSTIQFDDLLSRIITRNRQDFPDKYLRDFCVSFILAGRDTTSVGLAWFFWLVGKNPRVETKILDEIYRVLRNRGTKGHFKAEDLKEMVYLEAALAESLRLYPPVPTEMKEVTNDDVLPSGSIVKSGDRVLYSMFSMARMESLWGEDCSEFRPERWIRDGKVVSENQFKYAVFNGGPRLCLGKKFAYTQMKMVAASILLRFEVGVVHRRSIVPKVTTTLYMKHGLFVKLKPREVKI